MNRADSVSATTAIAAEDVSKELAGRLVLRGVSLTVRAGACVVVLGANGSGKSTLLNILATLWKPSAGRVLWNGRDVAAQRDLYRRRVGYIAHEPLVYAEWSARQNLRFLGRLHGVADADARIAALLDEVGLSAYADEPVHIYSRGMVQRLAIARAFLHSPDVLLLDEPSTGLDAATQGRLVRRLQDERREGAAAVVVTHDVALGHELADELVVLDRGFAQSIGRPPLSEVRERYEAALAS
jgi:heme exporter protein A